MLAEIAGFITGAIGVALRAAFGRDADGNPNPDNPTNLSFIFAASLAISGGIACVGSLVALCVADTLTPVWLTPTIVFGVGLLASFRAVYP